MDLKLTPERINLIRICLDVLAILLILGLFIYIFSEIRFLNQIGGGACDYCRERIGMICIYPI